MLSITRCLVPGAGAVKTRQILFTSCWVAALAGCAAATSPARLAGDVDVFAAGVMQATATYREQRDFFVAHRNEQEWARLRLAVREAEQGETPPFILIGNEIGGATCQDAVTDWAAAADRPISVEVTDGSGRQGIMAGISAADYEQGYKRILESCRLGLELDGRRTPLDLSRQTLSPLYDRLAAGLEQYVEGLRLLVSNVDRTEFDAAAADALGKFREFFASTQDIAIKLRESDDKPLEIDKELGVIGNALTSAIATSLEARRRQEIARVVVASQDIVARAAEKLAAISRHYHIAAAEKFSDDYVLAADAANTAIDRRASDFEQKIDQARKAEQDFHDFVRLDPAVAFNAMIGAHKALAGKVRDPDFDLGDLAGDIQDFYQLSAATLESLRSIRRKIAAQSKEGEPS